ncbi:MAG: hypothetical protein UT78_C0023G0004 [Candidatus Nomurabacteria bacterium GW2011_GWF2_40_12]|uniref:Uncharacterized protein n=1 Tax=Candidatus Nomurabacteria bacterium GW2011_GWF2_40_12 TaxID=1618776 RepID=A0A0G0QNC1_9BACT|nr:MAG: hypothetical protein UT78_C0023G0004 [Candidatus Nomurabacteria bacterium GW2011_GWF2_40_12]
MQNKTTDKTPPRLENFTSSRDNQENLHSMAKLFADYSKDFQIYFSRDNR